MTDAKTDIQKWTISPTPLERAFGRLLRGPDGHGDAGAGGDGASGDAGAGDAGAAGAGDGDGSQAGGAADAGDGSGADDTSLLAAATADDGAGSADGDKDAAGKDGDDGQAKDGADGPPETYELKVTVKDAEGKDQVVDVDPTLLTEATPILKDLGLSNEQANKVAGLVPKVQARLLEQQNDQFAATKADWAKQTKADTEIGGKNWKETQTLAAKALDHYAGGADKNEDGTYKSGFRQLLEDTGLTNHPDMARLLREVGKGLAEDSSLARGDGKIQKKSREEEMYPDDVPKK